jgi:siroheme synthase (precorrin-2 oxidase/ferrochelatase)
VPAVVRRGDLQVAIGTEGYCPAYASHLRKRLERVVTEEHGQFLAELEALRKRLFKAVLDPAGRKGLLGQLVSDASFHVFVEKGPAAWRRYAARQIRESTKSTE